MAAVLRPKELNMTINNILVRGVVKQPRPFSIGQPGQATICKSKLLSLRDILVNKDTEQHNKCTSAYN